MATPCFLVTADAIEGPWSNPVSIGAHGFDPSLFHDDDGKKYLLNMIWDGRKNHNPFAGIALQEFDPAAQSLIGNCVNIFKGSHLSVTEGPQIFKKDGHYYLVTAEGGTGFDHGITLCRATTLLGPWELHPQTPFISSRGQEQAELQRTGHGFFVETQNGEWYLSHLCGRPVINPEADSHLDIYKKWCCILGRETALQKIQWLDGWPQLEGGGSIAKAKVPAPNLPAQPWPQCSIRDQFEQQTLDIHYATLREPIEASWASTTHRRGTLRLLGRHYLYSRYEQSLIARRIQTFHMRAETSVEFEPTCPQQMAGLVAYYSRSAHYFMKITVNDAAQKVLQLAWFIDDEYGEEESAEVVLGTEGKVYLRLELKVQWYQYSYSLDGEQWAAFGSPLNSTHLSDEGSNDVFRFTGSMVGLFVADVSGQYQHADFDYFDYEELEQL
ncbi:MAG: xylan 1,4-beta-xylosidase [Oceanicoccus sp.]|jgi:xylan 1,4-beta-xylosidase